MNCSRGLIAAILLAVCFGAIVGDGTAPAQQDGPDPKAKKEAFDPGAISELQATLPQGWKDDETFVKVRRFMKKDGKEESYVFAVLYNGPAPKTGEALADLAKKKRDLFSADGAFIPLRWWAKTVGIGKLPDGVFIVGKGTAQGETEEEDLVGAVRTIDGKTVLFLAVPAGDAATRKEQLRIIRGARFGAEKGTSK
jgi:hypothetical protein